ncbi:MAG: hypothetical protein HY897_11335 [Deltaproteobacteria bacterium]|nr:hypothetical protein [Deltaproteobacteria bacterium]
MKDLQALSPTNAAQRVPKDASFAVLSSKTALLALPPRAAVPLVYWRNSAILAGVLHAAAEKDSALGIGLRLRVGEEYSPRLSGAFREFFSCVVEAATASGFSGPLFVRAELPYFSGAGDDEVATARRTVFAAYDAGFTSFSLKLPEDARMVQRLPEVLSEPREMELGFEFRHRVAGVAPSVLSRILGLLRSLGVAPDVMRPLDGPQVPAEFVGGVVVGAEWDPQAPRRQDARAALVTMDALISSVLRSVLDDSVRERLRTYQEREKTGLEDAWDWGIAQGIVPREKDEVLEARVFGEFCDALDRMGAAGTARYVRGER